MKYVDEMVVFQEIPGEISLSFSISNCPYHCTGCHSSYLANDIGVDIKTILVKKLRENKGNVSCILFMGGDDPKQINDLIDCLQICQSYGYKTAVYSGADEIHRELLPYVNYLKIGHYDEKLGPLKSNTTNQRLYKILVDGQLQDITCSFWKK